MADWHRVQHNGWQPTVGRRYELRRGANVYQLGIYEGRELNPVNGVLIYWFATGRELTPRAGCQEGSEIREVSRVESDHTQFTRSERGGRKRRKSRSRRRRRRRSNQR